MNVSKKIPKGYLTNPLTVATTGLDILFRLARPVAILFVIISLLSLFRDNTKPAASIKSSVEALEPEARLLVALLILIFIGVGILLSGISDYTAARLARGKRVTLREATRTVFSYFWSYAWLRILTTIKVVLWSLLLVIPGIIMAVRYSLAGVSFFDKQLRGNAALTHSSGLVKGAWLTTFASQTLFNIVTLGLLSSVLAPGTNAVLYRQLEKIKGDKPAAHPLSWLTVVLAAIILTLLVIAFIVLLPFIIIALADAA